MKVYHIASALVLALAVTLVVAGCAGQLAAPTPTLAVQAPTATTPATPAPTSTTEAMATAAATPAESASPAAAGVSIGELAAKARGNDQYSVNISATGPQPLNGKLYIKGTKLREEGSFGGQNAVMLVDTATKVAYMMIAGQNTAVKIDFSQAVAQTPNPTAQISALPANAKFVGTDTVDGKPSAIYDVTTSTGTSRVWIWTDRGLPLRVTVTEGQGAETMNFTNYDFSPQPDSLFELPPGTKVIEVPTNIPGLTPLPTP